MLPDPGYLAFQAPDTLNQGMGRKSRHGEEPEMNPNPRSGAHVALGVLTALGASCCLGSRAWAAPEYHSINATMADRTITLTGHDLTIDQVIQVARYGAKVQ